MLFSKEKEDDDDFFPSPKYKTNLASIFSNNPGHENSSLTYTAPKQPKPQKKSGPSVQPTSSTSSAVIVAKTVQSFKMYDGVYQNHGKLGAVVVSSCVDKETTYQLLLYRDKRTHICIARINRDFKFHIQPKDYASFYDKQNTIWSILFDSPDDLEEFTFQVALARWRMGDSSTPIMTQDLWCPVNESSDFVAELGDSVELTYTVNTIEMVTEDVDDSWSVNAVVGEKGWQQALVGVRPSSKIVIILQPFMLGDLNRKEIAYNSPVAVKLTVVKVNKKPDPTTITTSEPPHSLQPDTTDGPTEAPKATKADLITRMARMGQALPFKTVAPTPSDSDETEMGSMYPVPQVDNQAQFNMFFSEVRTTNSELRMGITRLTDKVEAIQSKLDSPEKNPPTHEMMTVLERLLQHEQQLKEQLQIVIHSFQNSHSQSGSGVSAAPSASSINDSYHVPPTPPAPSTSVTSVVEPCPECRQHEESQAFLAERIKQLEKENEFLKTTSNAQKEAIQNAKLADRDQLKRIEDLQNQLSDERLQTSKLNERIQTIETEKEALVENIEKKSNSLAELQKIILEKQLCIDKLEQALSESEAKSIDEVRNNLKEVLDQKLIVEEHAKKIFNAVYRLIKVQLKPQTDYNGAFVISVLADTIKAVTMEYLQSGDLSASNRQRQPLEVESSKILAEPLLDDSSNQVMTEGQYVRKEQRSPIPVEAKFSSTVFSEVPYDAYTNQAASMPFPRPELSVIVDNAERFQTQASSSSVHESEEGKSQANLHPQNAASSDDSSDGESIVSDKLRTVLLHHSRLQANSSSLPSSWQN